MQKILLVLAVISLGVFLSACSISRGNDDDGSCDFAPMTPSCNPNPTPIPPQDKYEILPSNHWLKETEDSISSGSDTTMSAQLFTVSPARGSTIIPPGCPRQCFQLEMKVCSFPEDSRATGASFAVYFSRDGINPEGSSITGGGAGPSNGGCENLPSGSLTLFPFPYVPGYLVVVADYWTPGPVRGSLVQIKGKTSFELDYK